MLNFTFQMNKTFEILYIEPIVERLESTISVYIVYCN